MKYRILYLSLLLFISGNACSSPNNLDVTTVNQVEPPTGECPPVPTVTLASSNVKSISLGESGVVESGIVSSNKHIGYTFTAESGQKISYQTEDDLCLWLYSPENQLIDTTELPTTGQYTLQIAAPQGSKSFDITIGFQTEQIARKETFSSFPTSERTSNQTFSFNPEHFPKYSCGDSKPTDPSDYPVAFYPVNVPYIESNLYIAQSYFCRDAFQKTSKDTGEKVVQISSFTNPEKAREFAEFIASQFSEVQIGSPTIIYE